MSGDLCLQTTRTDRDVSVSLLLSEILFSVHAGLFRDKTQADVSCADAILTVKRLQYNPETKTEIMKPAWNAKKQSWHWKRQNLHCSDFRDSFKEPP